MCDHRGIALFGRVSSSICIRQSSRKLLGEGDYIAMHTISSGIGCSIERYCQYCSMEIGAAFLSLHFCALTCMSTCTEPACLEPLGG